MTSKLPDNLPTGLKTKREQAAYMLGRQSQRGRMLLMYYGALVAGLVLGFLLAGTI